MYHINKNSKRGQHLIQQYLKSEHYTIQDCYANPSYNKRRAEAMCLHTMYADGGAFYKVLSYNTMQFTCGWRTANGGLRIETAQNTYIIENVFEEGD